MAGTRCKRCNSLVKIDEASQPNISSENFVQSLSIYSCTIRIVNQCERCGDELQEQYFFVVVSLKEMMSAHTCPNANEGVGWTARISEVERVIELVPPNKRVHKKFHVVNYGIRLKCNCGEFDKVYRARVKVAASDMVLV
jgi:hypothetical protein